MEDAVKNRVLDALKKHTPSKVRAWLSDDESQDIALGHARTRWSRCLDALDGLRWRRVDLLDKAGALIASVASDVEDAPASVASTGEAREERLLALLLKGQEVALKYRDAETTALLRAQAEVLKVLTDSVKALAAVHREQLNAAVDAAEARAEAESGGMLGQVAELLPHLPAIKAMLGAGTTPAPAPVPRKAVNGAG